MGIAFKVAVSEEQVDSAKRAVADATADPSTLLRAVKEKVQDDKRIQDALAARGVTFDDFDVVTFLDVTPPDDEASPEKVDTAPTAVAADEGAALDSMTLAEDGVENTPTTTQEPGIDADHEEALHGKAAANEEAKGHWQLDPAAVVALVGVATIVLKLVIGRSCSTNGPTPAPAIASCVAPPPENTGAPLALGSGILHPEAPPSDASAVVLDGRTSRQRTRRRRSRASSTAATETEVCVHACPDFFTQAFVFPIES